jgi:hypothetical protein
MYAVSTTRILIALLNGNQCGCESGPGVKPWKPQLDRPLRSTQTELK